MASMEPMTYDTAVQMLREDLKDCLNSLDELSPGDYYPTSEDTKGTTYKTQMQTLVDGTKQLLGIESPTELLCEGTFLAAILKPKQEGESYKVLMPKSLYILQAVMTGLADIPPLEEVFDKLLETLGEEMYHLRQIELPYYSALEENYEGFFRESARGYDEHVIELTAKEYAAAFREWFKNDQVTHDRFFKMLKAY